MVKALTVALLVLAGSVGAASSQPSFVGPKHYRTGSLRGKVNLFVSRGRRHS